MRILFCCLSALAVAAIFCLPGQADSGKNSLKVKTSSGGLIGKAINDGSVEAFLGIPYAAPPVGPLRWKAPELPVKWKGERDATQFGAHCAQGHVFDDMIFQDATGTGVNGSEDCLYLNVYRPTGAGKHSKLPVMLWIHGGGYEGGSASEPRHNGDYLPTKGVVLVTINYRLGPFGFLTLPELVKEGNGSAGNYGLLDMIAALQWVRANIGDFGGDRDNVTIFGESAGSFAVSTLMASPMARGLFARTIGESGAAFMTHKHVLTLDESAKRNAAATQKVLGTSSLAELRSMPANVFLANNLLEAIDEVIDGRVLTMPVDETFADGRQAHVPMLAGWNKDEGSFGVPPATVGNWKSFAKSTFGENDKEFLKLYPAATDAEAERSAIDYAGDKFIALVTWKWIEAHSKTGESPVYRYKLDLAAPPSKFHPARAFHSDDIEYVFGTLDTRPGAVWREEDRRLSEQMMDYWTNFAKTGDPNGPGLPLWPKYVSKGQVQHLDNPVTAQPDVSMGRYIFLVRDEENEPAEAIKNAAQSPQSPQSN